MIALLDNHEMAPIRQKALGTWTQQKINVNLFDAITPEEIPNLPIKLNLTRKEKTQVAGGPVPFTETEKAIWYSHFFLWQKCIMLDKPICVIEEDCQLTTNLPETFEVDGFTAICYHNKKLTPAAGYILTVDKAMYLYDYALSQTLQFNIDHLLIKNFDDKKRYAIQVERDWKTIEHWK